MVTELDLRKKLPVLVSGAVSDLDEELKEYPKVLPKLPSDQGYFFHATAYNVWPAWEKPEDEVLNLTKNMCVSEGYFTSPFFVSMSTRYNGVKINKDNWDPVGLIVLANRKHMDSHGDFHPQISSPNRLKLMGRTLSRILYMGDCERKAPVFVYPLEKSLER